MAQASEHAMPAQETECSPLFDVGQSLIAVELPERVDPCGALQPVEKLLARFRDASGLDHRLGRQAHERSRASAGERVLELEDGWEP